MINEILENFFGIFATIMLLSSYMAKNKKTFLVFLFVGDMTYGLAFIFAGSYSAGLISFISCLINMTFLLFEKKNKNIPKTLGVLFFLIYLSITLLNFSSWCDLIPLICYSFILISLYSKKMQSIRWLFLLPNVLFIVFDILIGAYANLLEDAVESVFIIFSIIYSYFRDKKLNKQNSKVQNILNKEKLK